MALPCERQDFSPSLTGKNLSASADSNSVIVVTVDIAEETEKPSNTPSDPSNSERTFVLKTIPRTKLRDVVAQRLKQYIVESNLKPGDRLPTETELAELFGVSRLSLREATKSLEYLGIVSAKPGKGMTVGSVNMDRVTECLGFHPALHQASMTQLIGTRVVIETGVLPYVCARMNEDASIFEKLSAINSELAQLPDLERRIELDIEFHRGLVEASGLSPFNPFADVLMVFFRRFRESLSKAEWSGGIEVHQKIIEFLQQGNHQDAAELLRVHIESHKERLPSTTTP